MPVPKLREIENDILRGSDHPKSKLTEAQVIRIRKEYREKQEEILEMRREFSVAAYADHYGVSFGAMDKIIRGVTWKHV